ncbi:MAG: hypothetical protein P8X91_00310 [Candidatus Bathyarchaeota archaeon]
MSGSLYRKDSHNDDILPQKQFYCNRCNQNINEPIEIKDKYGHETKKECPYTYYKGKLVCISCFLELEKTDPVTDDGKTVNPNSELF